MEPLAADLRRIYQGNAWHGPAVLDVIRDLTAEHLQRVAGPIPGTASSSSTDRNAPCAAR